MSRFIEFAPDDRSTCAVSEVSVSSQGCTHTVWSGGRSGSALSWQRPRESVQSKTTKAVPSTRTSVDRSRVLPRTADCLVRFDWSFLEMDIHAAVLVSGVTRGPEVRTRDWPLAGPQVRLLIRHRAGRFLCYYFSSALRLAMGVCLTKKVQKNAFVPFFKTDRAAKEAMAPERESGQIALR